jgi:hypothetical protein
MPDFTQLSAAQLRRAADIKTRIEHLQKELTRLLGNDRGSGPNAPVKPAKTKRKLNAAARKRISKAAKARWAKAKAAGRKKL